MAFVVDNQGFFFPIIFVRRWYRGLFVFEQKNSDEKFGRKIRMKNSDEKFGWKIPMSMEDR